jgi:hypothetical protein
MPPTKAPVSLACAGTWVRSVAERTAALVVAIINPLFLDMSDSP